MMESIASYASPNHDMLFSDLRTILSTDDTGVQLKQFAEISKLKFNLYYSYIDNGKKIRYFHISKARLRGVLPFVQGNIKNPSDIVVYSVTRFFINNYIKNGKIGKLNIRLNVSKIMGGRHFITIFRLLFGITGHWREFDILRVGGMTYISHKQEFTVSKVMLHPKSYKAWINNEEIIFHGEAKRFISLFWENICKK